MGVCSSIKICQICNNRRYVYLKKLKVPTKKDNYQFYRIHKLKMCFDCRLKYDDDKLIHLFLH